MRSEALTVEKVIQTLKDCDGNRQMALARLKCSPATLQNKIRLAKEQRIRVPPATIGRPTTVGEILNKQGFYKTDPGLPDNLDGLSDAPLYDSEPVANNRSAESMQTIDIDLVRKAGNTYGGRLDIHIAAGNWDAAKAVIDEARLDAKGEGNVVSLLDVTLADTGVPVRLLNSLESLDIIHVGDLAKHSSEQLLRIKNFGHKSLDVVWCLVLKLAATRDAMREATQQHLEDLKR